MSDSELIERVKNQLLEEAKSQSNGISNKDIYNLFPDVPLKQVTDVINKCLKNGYV